MLCTVSPLYHKSNICQAPSFEPFLEVMHTYPQCLASEFACETLRVNVYHKNTNDIAYPSNSPSIARDDITAINTNKKTGFLLHFCH